MNPGSSSANDLVTDLSALGDLQSSSIRTAKDYILIGKFRWDYFH